MDEHVTGSGQVVASECVQEAPPEAEPESAAESEAAIEPAPPARIPWWPAAGYGSVWAALTAATVWSLTRIADAPSVQQEAYPLILAGGLVLTLLGPVLGTVVWAVVWSDAPRTERGGLLTTSFVRASAVTLGGVATWWASLVLIDAWRLGRL